MRKYLIATLLIVTSVTAIPTVLANTFPDCPTEDSTYCLWDSSTRGNGSGTSFIAFGEGVTWLLK